MDPTFYRTAQDAIAAPREQLAYVVALDPTRKTPDALLVIDLDPESESYGQLVGRVDSPVLGDEFHHFGWNACSSAFQHEGHCMEGLQRRYLIVPGLRTSNIHVFDVGTDPRAPKLIKSVAGKELSDKAGYSRPHTVHCGPEGIFMTCLGGPHDDGDARGGIALLDHNTFDVLRAWETDHGPQHFHYDAWWHLNRNYLISSEWGSPSMVENGLVIEKLLANEYGHSLHFWDMLRGKHHQRIDLGLEQQMVLEVRPSHNPNATWGFVSVAISTKDLSGSIFRWYLDPDSKDSDPNWKTEKVITIPAEPVSDPSILPPILRPFGAVPPLITDCDLSVDDKYLYVSCWATGELKQFDVTNPACPVETGSIRLGGLANHTPHPSEPGVPCPGGPQMMEVSRDGRHLYFTSSLYSSWDDQFYPQGVGNWMAKVNIDVENGGMTIDESFFPHGEQFKDLRLHQIRLQGGDASTDSYCYRSNL
ncbi:hypothetical protein FDECE_17009 [Fusarium decemcellulare]|nr:hypothetical protein FDECE_17009 [Fusarium decemcellulare]